MEMRCTRESIVAGLAEMGPGDLLLGVPWLRRMEREIREIGKKNQEIDR